MICDGTSDCADGDDEEGCDDFVCSGALRCRLDNICIHPIDICDGVMHCPLSGDDELLCNNNNNNNNKVYTPLSEKCTQSIVFISQCHIIHIVQYYAYWLVWFM